MAEDARKTSLCAAEAVSRSRSGSSSGSSEADMSPICKISPLVSPSTSSVPPLTPKKRHRAKMEQEARQEALRVVEKEKGDSEEKTLTVGEENSKLGQNEPEMEDKVADLAPVALSSETKTKEDTDIKSSPRPKRKAATTKRKIENDDFISTSATPGKLKRTPRKLRGNTESPASGKTNKESPAPKRTPATPIMSGAGDGPSLPEGWKRVVVQRMQGESAGKFDVYIWSPSGRKFRSRPQLLAYLEETGSSLSIDNFSFKHKGTPATPARVKKVTPDKKEKKSPKKKTPKDESKPKRGRPRKTSEGRSPSKGGSAKLKQGKQQRKVLKPPPDIGSKKASRAQQLQKLLVKIKFQKPGDIREMSSDDSSSEASSEDDFDPGTTEEAGPDLSDGSVTSSPPSVKKIRRHSSPSV